MGLTPTPIEWVRNPDGSPGFTSNPFTGCRNGCPYCYARREAYGRCKKTDMSGIPVPVSHSQDTEAKNDPFAPRYHPGRLADIEKRKKPVGIFLCNRSDFFADYWPDIWQQNIWATVKACSQHIIYLLTKQPAQLHEFSPFPDHCRVGVSIESSEMAYGRVISCHMENIEAKVKYISIEPLLGQVKGAVPTWCNWIIIGACTGTLKDMQDLSVQYPELTLMPYGKKWTLQPKIGWVREIVEAADMAGVPVFLKANIIPALHGLEPFYKPLSPSGQGSWELRQEMPV